jgi:putative Holliday junction resolvase
VIALDGRAARPQRGHTPTTAPEPPDRDGQAMPARARTRAGPAPNVNVLGFDYGSRLIGVALGNRLTGTARPLGTVVNRDGGPDWSRIEHWIHEWQPDALIVGLPLTLDGLEQPASHGARAFGAALARRYALPLHLVDERRSSIEAARRFAQRRAAGIAKKKHAADIDAVAAEVITETWLADPS